MSKDPPQRLTIPVAEVRAKYTLDLIRHVNEMLEPWKRAGFTEEDMTVELVRVGKNNKWIVYPKGR